METTRWPPVIPRTTQRTTKLKKCKLQKIYFNIMQQKLNNIVNCKKLRCPIKIIHQKLNNIVNCTKLRCLFKINQILENTILNSNEDMIMLPEHNYNSSKDFGV